MTGSQHSSGLGRLLARLAPVRDPELPALLWSAAAFFFLLCGYMILRPLRDAMGLAAGVDNLQWLFTITFFVMLAAVPAFSAMVSRLGRTRFVPYVYHFVVLSLVGLFIALSTTDGEARAVVARVFYVWVSVFNLFIVSVFWALMADLYSPEQGRRLFGFIGVGGTLGALTGPFLTAMFVEPLGVENLLLGSAFLLEGAVLCVHRVLRHSNRLRGTEEKRDDGKDQPIGGSMFSGIAQVFRSRYLLGISGFLLLFSCTSTFLYFELANIIDVAIQGDEQRTALFAKMDFTVNLIAALVQASLTARIIGALGIGRTLTILPIVTGLGFLALAFEPGLWIVVPFQVIRRASEFATAKPAREVLFTVVGREQKYKSKAFMDTVVPRGGDVGTGWAFAGLQALGMGLGGIAMLVAPLAIVWAWLGVTLGHQCRERQNDTS